MRKIILTGATGGLGRCLSNEIIGAGIGDLICIYRNQRKFDDIFPQNNLGIEKYLVTAHEDFSRLTELLDHKGCDEIILILNAFSILPIKRMGSFTADEIEDAVHGNIVQNFHLLNRISGFCQENMTDLRVINIDSGAADFPLTGWGSYCASKAFINSLLSVLALENQNYRIVSFDPGVMDTDMQAAIRAADKEIFQQVGTFIGYKTEGRLNKPSDVAKQIKERYLCDWRASSLREKYKA